MWKSTGAPISAYWVELSGIKVCWPLAVRKGLALPLRLRDLAQRFGQISGTVILSERSEAKNPSIWRIRFMQEFFVAFGSSE